jgi:hypothetical protein
MRPVVWERPSPCQIADCYVCRSLHVPVVLGGSTVRHRPSYVPADARYVPVAARTYRPAARPPVLTGALIVLGALVVAIALVALFRFANAIDTANAPASQPFGVFVTPTTYGPPGPDGGPVPLPTVVAGCCR